MACPWTTMASRRAWPPPALRRAHSFSACTNNRYSIERGCSRLHQGNFRSQSAWRGAACTYRPGWRLRMRRSTPCVGRWSKFRMSCEPFGASYSLAYDALYRDKDYVSECDFVEAAIRRHGSGGDHRKVLDLGCGTGGHSIELARRGYTVRGVDLSPHMLSVARAKC